jgi:RNA recognition motif-containing protein
MIKALIILYIRTPARLLYINNLSGLSLLFNFLITEQDLVEFEREEIPDEFTQFYKDKSRVLINYEIQELAKFFNTSPRRIMWIILNSPSH